MLCGFVWCPSDENQVYDLNLSLNGPQVAGRNQPTPWLLELKLYRLSVS